MTGAGKGDKPRPIKDMKQYRDNWTHALDKDNCKCEECTKLKNIEEK